MNSAPSLHSPSLILSSLLLVALSSGLVHCGEEIEVENTLATIDEPRDVTVTPQDTIGITYTLSDLEGDDQSILVEVCEGSADAPTRCGLAIEGPGSDGVTFVPTQQGGAAKTHRFAWDARCGRIPAEQKGEALVSMLDTNYVFRLRVRDDRSDWRYGEPFTLTMLGVDELGTCSLKN